MPSGRTVGPIERIYKHLHRIVENPDLRLGVTLAALAAAIKCGVKSPAIRTQISVTKLTRHYDKLDIRNVIPSSGLGSVATARPYPTRKVYSTVILAFRNAVTYA